MYVRKRGKQDGVVIVDIGHNWNNCICGYRCFYYMGINRSNKFFIKTFEKPLDKFGRMWYNIYTEKERRTQK